MKILVTGYKGFIGSNLFEFLESYGHEVHGHEWGDELYIVRHYDCVMHLGAISSTTETNVEKVMMQNYEFTKWLYNMCMKQGVDFQFASSASIYGLGTDFNETAPVDPRSPYAWSKYLCERYLMEAKEYSGIKTQIFRYFNVYGKNEDHKGTQASPYHQFKKQNDEFGYCNIFKGSRNFKRDFVPVEVVCDVHRRFLNCPESGIWNVGTGNVKSFLEVANSITPNHKVIPFPKHLEHSYQKYTCADMNKMKLTIAKYML